MISQTCLVRAPTTYLFELIEQIDTKINQKIKSGWFFLLLKNNIKIIQMEMMVFDMNIIKQELQFEEWYIEPHRVIIKNITFLVFNYYNDVYITNLTKKIKLSELEEYLKNI